MLLRRRAHIDRRLWRRAYLRYQARLMGRVERRWCGRVGERGRATVERCYSWEVIGQAMINTYVRLAGSHSHDLVPARSSPDYSRVR